MLISARLAAALSTNFVVDDLDDCWLVVAFIVVVCVRSGCDEDAVVWLYESTRILSSFLVKVLREVV